MEAAEEMAILKEKVKFYREKLMKIRRLCDSKSHVNAEKSSYVIADYALKKKF